MPRASIDIGSNSLLLYVVDDDGVPLHDEARVVGLGHGLDETGHFDEERMKHAAQVLAAYAERARRLGVHPIAVRAVATSAARRASNAESFFAEIELVTGVSVEIISGLEEARLTWQGARAGLELPAGPIAVVDLGGGSTEVAFGDGEQIARRESLELGCVRLLDRFLGPAPERYDPGAVAQLSAHVAEVVGQLQAGRPEAVVAVAGTATTLAAMDAGLVRYEGAVVHGRRLTRAGLAAWATRLADTDREQRRRLAAVSPDRADLLLPGSIVLDAMAARLGVEELLVSDGGLRHALVAN